MERRLEWVSSLPMVLSRNRPRLKRQGSGSDAQPKVSRGIISLKMLVLMVSWVTFRLKDYVKRVDLGITTLLLFIAFNFTLGSDLPRLGYLTFVDAFIAGTFVITGAVIVVNVQLRVWELQGREANAQRLDRIATMGYWPAYLLGMCAALLLI